VPSTTTPAAIPVQSQILAPRAVVGRRRRAGGDSGRVAGEAPGSVTIRLTSTITAVCEGTSMCALTRAGRASSAETLWLPAPRRARAERIRVERLAVDPHQHVLREVLLASTVRRATCLDSACSTAVRARADRAVEPSRSTVCTWLKRLLVLLQLEQAAARL
jgi:hypothetical protein